jgi:hypothetical protein
MCAHLRNGQRRDPLPFRPGRFTTATGLEATKRSWTAAGVDRAQQGHEQSPSWREHLGAIRHPRLHLGWAHGGEPDEIPGECRRCASRSAS